MGANLFSSTSSSGLLYIFHLMFAGRQILNALELSFLSLKYLEIASTSDVVMMSLRVHSRTFDFYLISAKLIGLLTAVTF